MIAATEAYLEDQDKSCYQQRADDSKSFFSPSSRNKQDFFRQYVTVDKTWIQYFTRESKQLSAKWRASGYSHPKHPQSQQSAGVIIYINYPLLWFNRVIQSNNGVFLT